MAEVERLSGYDELSLIGKYAERFGLDPNYVYHNTSFNTVMNFLTMWKETEEYHERFMNFWTELNNVGNEPANNNR
jgi:hypothetical protein